MQPEAPIELSQTRRAPKPSVWPLVIVVLLTYAYNFASIWVIVNVTLPTFLAGFRLSAIFESILIGSYLGQLIVGVVLCGLLGRSWLEGWIVGLLVALGAFVSGCLAGGYEYEDWLVVLGIVLASPLVSLAAIMPLVALRNLSGWSLTLGSEIETPRVSASLEDLFSLSIVVACSLSLASFSSRAEPRVSLAQLLVICCFFAVTSLVVLVPLVVITFRSRSWFKIVIGWLTLIVVACVAVIGFRLVVEPDFDWSTDFDFILATFASSGMVLALFLGVMLVSGWRLTRFATASAVAPASAISSATSSAEMPATATESDPFAAEEPSATFETPSGRRFSRTCVALIVAVVLACLGGNAWHDRRVASFYGELKRELGADGLLADVSLKDDLLYGIQLKPGAMDDQLIEALKYYGAGLSFIDLSHTNITDKGLEALAEHPRITMCYLGHTSITDEGLRRMLSRMRLVNLSVAHTKISLETALLACDQPRTYMRLDLSGLGITDEQLARTPMPYVTQIKLSDNPVTDIGIEALLKQSAIEWLDVSDTQVTMAKIPAGKCPATMILDGSKVTDATVRGIIKAGCNRLSLKETKITAALLPALAVGNLATTFGGSSITEADLAPLAGSFWRLGLQGPEFTGESLRLGMLNTSNLDLSYSSATDDTLRETLQNTAYSNINLSHTNVTDAVLDSVFANALILTNTKITPAGVRSLRSVNCNVYMDLKYVTAEQAAALRAAGVLFNQTYLQN